MSNSQLRFKKKCLFIPQDENSSFSSIPLEMIRDNSISIEARGVMCYLLSLPKKQKISRLLIEKRNKGQKEEINSTIDELIKADYLEEVQE